MSKLIVIRGPSGAGKSTVAAELHKRCPNPALLINEDKIRFMFNNWQEPAHTASKQLATAMILQGLKSGFDVIYEGISNVKTYDKYFRQILDSHENDNYFFYLDVSFDESLKRHETRPEKSKFGAEEMSKWRDYASLAGYADETIIPESSSLEDTINLIQKITKLTTNSSE